MKVIPTLGAIEVNRFSRDSQATETIPASTDFNVQSDPRFGRHEGLSYYTRCYWRSRNQGLWIADRFLGGNSSTFTRQNNNGNRYGLECPEARDYWPYWGASPWRDVATLTSRPERCADVSQSQNVVTKYECICSSCIALQEYAALDQSLCTAVGGTWTPFASFSSSAPFCGAASLAPVNEMTVASFNWTLPTSVVDLDTCVLRIRYNITSGDTSSNTSGIIVDVNGTYLLNGANSPLKGCQKFKSGFVQVVR